MLVSPPKVGDKVNWSIGRRGQAPDTYAARVKEALHQGIDDVGRPGGVITLIVQRTNLAGQTFLREQKVLGDRFLFPRTTAVEELDGTADQPKTIVDLVNEANEALQAFLASQGSTDFADMAAEVESA